MQQLLISSLFITILMLVSLAFAIGMLCLLTPNGCDLGIVESTELGIPTLIGYAFSPLLLWIGWKTSARVKEDGMRIVVRTGLIAFVLTPSVLSDPGVAFTFWMPAWIPTLCYMIFPPAALAVGFLPASVIWLVLLFIASGSLGAQAER